YRVRSFGAGTTFRCRLEDDAGWPVEPPNVPADLTRHLEPGTYQGVSLPEPVATRRVTLFERARRAEKRGGQGPPGGAPAEPGARLAGGPRGRAAQHPRRLRARRVARAARRRSRPRRLRAGRRAPFGRARRPRAARLVRLRRRAGARVRRRGPPGGGERRRRR